jgi:PBP1b-binding outer membrane lipoprotein LpoB
MKPITYLLLVLVFLSACSPSVVVTSSWKNAEMLNSPTKKTYKTIFISALTGTVSIKSTVEIAFATAIEKKGYKTIKGQDMFAPGLKNNPDTEESALKKIKEAGSDGIFTIALVDKESETRYVPGSVGYSPYPMHGYYGSYWGYHGYYGAAMYSSPGYYTTDKTYFIESNLYDVDTGKIVWSSQSKTVNPSDLTSFSEKYTDAIIKQLEDDGLLKK